MSKLCKGALAAGTRHTTPNEQRKQRLGQQPHTWPLNTMALLQVSVTRSKMPCTVVTSCTHTCVATQHNTTQGSVAACKSREDENHLAVAQHACSKTTHPGLNARFDGGEIHGLFDDLAVPWCVRFTHLLHCTHPSKHTRRGQGIDRVQHSHDQARHTRKHTHTHASTTHCTANVPVCETVAHTCSS